MNELEGALVTRHTDQENKDEEMEISPPQPLKEVEEEDLVSLDPSTILSHDVMNQMLSVPRSRRSKRNIKKR